MVGFLRPMLLLHLPLLRLQGVLPQPSQLSHNNNRGCLCSSKCNRRHLLHRFSRGHLPLALLAGDTKRSRNNIAFNLESLQMVDPRHSITSLTLLLAWKTCRPQPQLLQRLPLLHLQPRQPFPQHRRTVQELLQHPLRLEAQAALLECQFNPRWQDRLLYHPQRQVLEVAMGLLVWVEPQRHHPRHNVLSAQSLQQASHLQATQNLV
mmetsp:Transcript_20829/g.45125  ORF Transcript_20829/g.45125 Transcript_20829/m.45125 type:complete len:207 (-) Transcript_20829:12827-13447(-)